MQKQILKAPIGHRRTNILRESRPVNPKFFRRKAANFDPAVAHGQQQGSC